MSRPLLLLDVDGVLAVEAPLPHGYEKHAVVSSIGNKHVVGLNTSHGIWLRLLSRTFEIVWATGWEHDAPRLLGPLIDLPAFPVLEFTQRPKLGTPLNKAGDVARFVSARAAAWVDDDHGDEAIAWAAARSDPTLLVRPDPTRGLEASHVAELRRFGSSALWDT